MELDYLCVWKPGVEPPGRWPGRIRLIKDTDPYEMEATARYSSFHILCGKHKYGNYICIPNWDIGTELSGLSDSFWNFERLTTYYPNLSKADAASIVGALERLDKYILSKEGAG